MAVHRRRAAIGKRRAPLRALAAIVPLAVAACSAFGLEDGTAPAPSPEAGADDAAEARIDADQTDDGGAAADRQVPPDAARLPDAAACIVVEDGFEGMDWKPEPNWTRDVFGTAVLDRPNIVRAGGGMFSLRVSTSTAESHARLGRDIQQTCTLSFSVWLRLISHNSNDSRILGVTTEDGANLAVLMREGKLALLDGTMERGSVPLPMDDEWRRLVFTYTMNGGVTLGLGTPKFSVGLERKPITRLDFGLLGAESGSDNILFDDVELVY